MTKTFLISDTHFGHSNILTFDTKEGNKLRNFSSVDEMDETMIQNWNKSITLQLTLRRLDRGLNECLNP